MSPATAYGTAAATRRAYYALSALRWLPTGMLIPILVLFAGSRGLTLAEIGLAMALQAAVVIVLELPAGGLADAVGRRPVLAGAAAVSTVSVAVLLFANGLAGFVVAMMLQGVFRALDSGPLEAWYVDAALASDPGRDLARDLARANTVVYVAVAAGALLTGAAGLLPVADPLTPAVAVSLGFEAVNVVAVLVLMREGRPRVDLGAAVSAVCDTPRVVRDAVRLGWTRRPLRLLVAVELFWGVGLMVVELLWQPRTAQLLGSTTDTAVFGGLSAAGWVAGALGSALLPAVLRWTGCSTTAAAAAMRVLQGIAVLGIGIGGGVPGVAVAYLAFYLVHGAANPAHAVLVHRQVRDGDRATVLSINSLVFRVGGLVASATAGLLAESSGMVVAFAVGAAVTAAAAPLYLMSARADRLEPAAQRRAGGTS
ncbi:MFS transporter [Pseudonocardia sp. GCM10023141]|uniref:MFS transporter n=1 Tax=Pseudonocardia sp. GCM10023141 TaxID=3252653 RepID=UPI003605FCD2